MRADFYNRSKVSRVISPDEGAGDNVAKVGEIIDTKDYQSLTFLIATGTLVDADAVFTVLVDEGDNSALTDAAAVADADLLGTETLAEFQFDEDDEVRKIGYIGGKRYVRLTLTPATNTGAWDVSVVAVQHTPRHAPSQDGAGVAITQVP